MAAQWQWERRAQKQEKAKRTMPMHGRRTGEVYRNAVTRRAGFSKQSPN